MANVESVDSEVGPGIEMGGGEQVGLPPTVTDKLGPEFGDRMLRPTGGDDGGKVRRQRAESRLRRFVEWGDPINSALEGRFSISLDATQSLTDWVELTVRLVRLTADGWSHRHASATLRGGMELLGPEAIERLARQLQDAGVAVLLRAASLQILGGTDGGIPIEMGLRYSAFQGASNHWRISGPIDWEVPGAGSEVLPRVEDVGLQTVGGPRVTELESSSLSVSESDTVSVEANRPAVRIEDVRPSPSRSSLFDEFGRPLPRVPASDGIGRDVRKFP